MPVLDGQRVSDGADIDLDAEELRRGVWVGERTLRLPNGWEVVFAAPRTDDNDATFPPEPDGHAVSAAGLRSERFAFQVAEKHYTLQFWRMTYLEGYDDRQLAALEASAAYEVSFRLEDYTLPDGSVIAGYDTMSVGNPFQVLGIVANAVMEWAQRRQPDFLYWQAHGARRQQVYEKMIRCFAARGSGWHRLPVDPFTRLGWQPDVFWLTRTSHGLVSHPAGLFHGSRSPVS